MRKRVYIAGPISKGDLCHNINQGTAAFVALTKAGFAPFCPHWSVYAKPCRATSPDARDNRQRVECLGDWKGNDDMSHEDWMGVDLPWVQISHAVLRLPGESVGADLEVKHANENGIPVFTDTTELIAHFAKAETAPC